MKKFILITVFLISSATFACPLSFLGLGKYVGALSDGSVCTVEVSSLGNGYSVTLIEQSGVSEDNTIDPNKMYVFKYKANDTRFDIKLCETSENVFFAKINFKDDEQYSSKVRQMIKVQPLTPNDTSITIGKNDSILGLGGYHQATCFLSLK